MLNGHPRVFEMSSALHLDLAARETAVLRPTLILEGLASTGYHIFPDSLPCRVWFQELYQAYDRVSQLLRSAPSLRDEWEACVHQWHGVDDTRAFYCGVPPVFRDKSSQEGKRDKEYIQYCLDFAEFSGFLKSRVYQEIPIRKMFELLRELHFTCTELFFAGITAVTEAAPWLRNKLVYHDRMAPVVLKVLRYNPNPSRFATGPHFDKSALSLLLHSDDEEVSYRLGKHKTEDLRYSELFAPISYPVRADAPNHAVLIAGSCLQAVGVAKLPPTPHSVIPVTDSEHRHSIVAFYLFPYLDTTALSPKARYINDLYPHVT